MVLLKDKSGTEHNNMHSLMLLTVVCNHKTDWEISSML